MAPHVIADEYDKDLNVLSKGIIVESKIKLCSFYNKQDFTIYKIYEYAIEGSTLHACFEVCVLIYKPEDNFTTEYAGELFNSGKSPEDSAAEALNLRIDPENEIVIARYVTSKKSVFFNQIECSGMQIKGAFVHSDYKQVRISSYVYTKIYEKYGMLMSDNIQTIEGHRLWAFGVQRIDNVYIYDTKINQTISALPKQGITTDVIPWSVSPKLQNLDNLREGFYTLNDSEDLQHITLFICKENSKP